MPPRLDLLAISLIAILALPAPLFAQDNLREVPPTDPQYELESLNIAEGYELNLFAADPMIEKPIQMAWDERGRLWVAGSTIYPHLLPGQEPDDKIFILEDTDGDGQADKSTLFADGLLTPTGLLIGDGGAYVANSTEILHLRDLDGDGYAEDRRVVLRGFGADDVHHLIHAFRWGPDGMMYFNQSIYIFSHVETPWGVRRMRQGGVWHYRPDIQKLDPFMWGFYNAWGHEFDTWGQSFMTDGAGFEGIAHVFPGAMYPATYGAERILRGMNPDNPKYSGLAIVSGRHLPDSLQGNLITNDYRANRVSRFVISDNEDGYVSTQRRDLIWSDHVAFRPVDVSVGPDGALYLADWYNPIIQHGEVDFRDPRRDHVHGRIWRITAKDRPLVQPPALVDASVEELLDMLRLPEKWTQTQARRLLKERGQETVLPVLGSWIENLSPADPDFERLRLEGLWLHQALGVINEDLLRAVLESKEGRVRAAAVRVLYHWQDHITNSLPLLRQAIADPFMRVRREAVTALGRQTSAEAAQIALNALDRPMNEFLDYALWYTMRELEPYWSPRLAEDQTFFGNDLRRRLFAWKAVHTPEAMEQLMALYERNEIPAEDSRAVLDLIVQYGEERDLQSILALAVSGETIGGNDQAAHLAALEEAASTYARHPSEPLDDIGQLLDHDDPEIRTRAVRLIGFWRLESFDDRLFEAARQDDDPDLRQAAVDALARFEDPAVQAQLRDLMAPENSPALRVLAARAMIASDPESAAPEAVALLNTLPADADPRPVFEAFYRQEGGREALANALQEQAIPAAFATIGLTSLRGNRERYRDLLEALEASGGVAPVERMPQTMSALSMDRLELDIKASGDPARGEAVYRRKELLCEACHALGGAGGQVGPDLSSVGANAPTDYLIESLLDPQKAVKDGYALTRITRTDGQMVSGTLIRNTGSAILLRDASNRVVTVPLNLVEKQEIVPGSLMPPGLTAPLLREEFMDLVAFLSALGENGPYRVPEAPYVRYWKAAPALETSSTTPAALKAALDNRPDAFSVTVYSKVDGALPLSDIPQFDAAGRPWSVLQFQMEVLEAGAIVLEVSGGTGVFWSAGGAPEALEGETISLDLEAGTHTITLFVDRSAYTSDALDIELRPNESTARAQLVHAAEG